MKALSILFLNSILGEIFLGAPAVGPFPLATSFTDLPQSDCPSLGHVSGGCFYLSRIRCQCMRSLKTNLTLTNFLSSRLLNTSVSVCCHSMIKLSCYPPNDVILLFIKDFSDVHRRSKESNMCDKFMITNKRQADKNGDITELISVGFSLFIQGRYDERRVYLSFSQCVHDCFIALKD